MGEGKGGYVQHLPAAGSVIRKPNKLGEGGRYIPDSFTLVTGSIAEACLPTWHYMDSALLTLTYITLPQVQPETYAQVRRQLFDQ